MHKQKQLYYIGLGLSLLFAVAYVLFIDYISFPWRDEIGTSDTAVNVALYGEWISHVWKYSYNPLHAFLLIGWLKIWGVSHLTVCSFTVLLAFVSYAVLLNILQKRELLTGVVGVIVFTLLYWGGFRFADLITLGRTDLLVMLFTILLVNEVTPTKEGGFYHAKRWPTMLFAFLLMWASIYSIPVLCCYCAVVYLVNNDKLIRKELRWRYLYAIIGFVVSFILVCLFFYAVHGLFKFINSYMSFNATISHDDRGRGLLTRLMDAYRVDIYALVVLLVTTLVLGVQKKVRDKRVLGNLLFTACIPMLMVFAGRYRFYYSWIFYVPVICLAEYAFSQIQKKWALGCVLIAAALSVMIRPLAKAQEFADKRTQLEGIEKFVEESSSYIGVRDDVLFDNSMFYYALVDRRYTPWQKYKGLDDIPQPEEKFKAFLEKKVSDEGRRQQFLEIFNKMEHSEPYLPESGYFYVDGKDGYMHTVEYMQEHGYDVNDLKKDGEYALLHFSKSVDEQ